MTSQETQEEMLSNLKSANETEDCFCIKCGFTDHTTSECTPRSEEHTSELQSHSDLVCRLLLEKKKKKNAIQSL